MRSWTAPGAALGWGTREAGHWHQAQEALSSVQELREKVNRLADQVPARRPADETGYQENP